MNPKHVLDYIDYRLPRLQKRHDDNKDEYFEYKAKYEAKWWNKIFGCKYNGMWDFWDWCYYAARIEELNMLRKEALYKFKMEYPRMDIPREWQDGFYKWAEENNIPY